MRVKNPKPPHWSAKILLASWQRLADFFGDENMPSGRGTDAYGHGHYGVVWPTSSGLAFKLTSDPSEAELVAWLLAHENDLNAHNMRGIVQYYGIAKVGGAKYRKRQVYAILREQARAVGVAMEMGIIGERWDFDFAFQNYMRYSYELRCVRRGARCRPARPGGPSREVRRAYWLEACEKALLSLGQVPAGEAVAAVLLELLGEGVVLADVHYNNIGILTRNGSEIIGITDPGHAVFLDPLYKPHPVAEV